MNTEGQLYELLEDKGSQNPNVDCDTTTMFFRSREAKYLRVKGFDGNGDFLSGAEILDKNKVYLETSCCRIASKYFKKVSSVDDMIKATLTETQKRGYSDDARALVEAGFYTTDLKLADQAHFIAFLQEKFEKEYADNARTELGEAKKAEAKAKTGK